MLMSGGCVRCVLAPEMPHIIDGVAVFLCAVCAVLQFIKYLSAHGRGSIVNRCFVCVCALLRVAHLLCC